MNKYEESAEVVAKVLSQFNLSAKEKVTLLLALAINLGLKTISVNEFSSLFVNLLTLQSEGKL